MTPELSICIPTCNRAALLERSLDAALHQCLELPVEICVSNNASADRTEQLLASLAARHPQLRYENRPQNIGIDRNILAAVRMARGNYVLPIGDDEVLAPGAVAAILVALRRRPDLLILNGCYVAPGSVSDPRIAKILQGCTITSPLEAFTVLWDQMPLGGFIAPRGYASPRFADRYLGTHHAYSGAVWDFLLAGFKYTGHVAITVTTESLIEFHRVKKAWASDAGAILFEQIPQWFDLLPAYYETVAAIALNEYRSRCSTSAQLLHFRAARQLTPARVTAWTGNFGFCARLRARAIAFLPVFAALLLARVAHVLVRAVSGLISILRPGSVSPRGVATSGDTARVSARANSLRENFRA